MVVPEYKNPLISKSLTDETEAGEGGVAVYTHDCHNRPICSSYGEVFFACLAGAHAHESVLPGNWYDMSSLKWEKADYPGAP